MSRSAVDYEEYEYDDLLLALQEKEIAEEVIKDCRNIECDLTIKIKEDKYILTINYATKSKEDNK